MKSSTKDKLAGKMHEVSGKAKEKVGQTTDNPELAAEGTDEKLGGVIQKKLGDVKKVFGR